MNRGKGIVTGIHVQDLSLRPAHAHNAAWLKLDSGEEDRGAVIVRRAGMTGVMYPRVS